MGLVGVPDDEGLVLVEAEVPERPVGRRADLGLGRVVVGVERDGDVVDRLRDPARRGLVPHLGRDRVRVDGPPASIPSIMFRVSAQPTRPSSPTR